MKDPNSMIRYVFDAIDESEVTSYSELINYLRAMDEWELVIFAMENGEMFERYFNSLNASRYVDDEYDDELEEDFTNDCLDEICCINSIPENCPGNIAGVVYGLMDWGTSIGVAIDVAIEVKKREPNIVWRKADDDMKDGIYFIVGVKKNENKELRFAGTYAKYAEGRWSGYFDDDTSDHLCGLTPVAYDANDIMGLDEEERFLEETGGGLKTLSE